jgi:hypothetical protein
MKIERMRRMQAQQEKSNQEKKQQAAGHWQAVEQENRPLIQMGEPKPSPSCCSSSGKVSLTARCKNCGHQADHEKQ